MFTLVFPRFMIVTDSFMGSMGVVWRLSAGHEDVGGLFGQLNQRFP